MTHVRSGAIVLPIALAMASMPSAARAESLIDAWGLALPVNARLQAQNLETAAAERNLAAAKQAWIPTVRTYNINAIISSTPKVKVPALAGAAPGAGATAAGAAGMTVPVLGPHQTDLPISFTSASVPIYTGGRIKNTIISAGSQRNVQRSEEFRTMLDLKVTVAEAYISVLRARRNLEVAESNVSQLESFARDITNRKKEGLATRNDELSAEVSLANARLGAIRERNTLEIAWATYNRYLCRPMGTVVPLDELAEDPAVPDLSQVTSQALRGHPELGIAGEAEIQQLTAMALQGRPELTGLAEQARALGAQAESTRAGVRPQASFVGGYFFLGNQISVPQGFGTAAFLLDWTIVDAPTRRRAEALKLQECAALKRRADAAQDIMLQVRTRWLDLQTSRQRVAVSRTAIAQAEENIKVVLDRYRQQLSNNTDVLDAESRRVQSLGNYYGAVYDEALARVRLHRAIGDL
jgi:outer membrane protein